jgi:hypothetical protein
MALTVPLTLAHQVALPVAVPYTRAMRRCIPCAWLTPHAVWLQGQPKINGKGSHGVAVGGSRLLTAVLRTLPLWLTVLLLLLTRIEAFGIREPIRRKDPHLTVHLRSLFDFRVSAALVVSVSSIFGIDDPSLAWSYELLYVPFLLPFVAASLVTVLIFRRSLPQDFSIAHPFLEAAHRCVAESTIAHRRCLSWPLQVTLCAAIGSRRLPLLPIWPQLLISLCFVSA